MFGVLNKHYLIWILLGLITLLIIMIFGVGFFGYWRELGTKKSADTGKATPATGISLDDLPTLPSLPSQTIEKLPEQLQQLQQIPKLPPEIFACLEKRLGKGFLERFQKGELKGLEGLIQECLIQKLPIPFSF